MKYKVGDKLLIRSKIMPKERYDTFDETKEVRVCTSCSNGWDIFPIAKCRIEYGYVIHEVTITGIDHYADGRRTYHCTNDLSTTGMGWQGVSDEDVVGKIKNKEWLERLLNNEWVNIKILKRKR